MRALLDINVLIALHDRDHIHHLRAASWFETNITNGWASCPLTQNGCLRIMSQPAYTHAQPLHQLMVMLQRSTSTPHHEFWPDSLSLLSQAHFNSMQMHSHSQLTDLYLLALAVQHGGRLVSFDQRIPLGSVNGASNAHLLIL